MAELIARMKVQVSFEAVQNSPELQDLLRQLIREELANLDQKAADKLATQVMGRIATAARITRG